MNRFVLSLTLILNVFCSVGQSVFNEPLAQNLERIFFTAQQWRVEIDSIAKKFGYESKEMETNWMRMRRQDSLNLDAVEEILSRY